METDTLNLGNSSRLIGSKRESFNALVNAYSFKPECKFSSLNVPMQPRRRWSLPIFHVTNSGLQLKVIHINYWLFGRDLIRNAQWGICYAQVIWFDVLILTSVQFLVQHVEAKEGHLGHDNFRVGNEAITVAIMLIMLRWMSILEWEKLFARHLCLDLVVRKKIYE